MNFHAIFNQSSGRVRQLHSGAGEIEPLLLEGESVLELDLQTYTQLMEAARNGATLSILGGIPRISPHLQLQGLPPISINRNGSEIREVQVPTSLELSWEGGGEISFFINMEKVSASPPFSINLPSPGAYRISVDDPSFAQETWVIHGVS